MDCTLDSPFWYVYINAPSHDYRVQQLEEAHKTECLVIACFLRRIVMSYISGPCKNCHQQFALLLPRKTGLH